MTAPIIWVCEECGSDNVSDMAIVKWDITAQDWRGFGHDCGDFCEDCGDNTGLIERPLTLKEIAQVAIKKQEKVHANTT